MLGGVTAGMAQGHGNAVDRRHYLHGHRPLAARGDRGVPAQCVRFDGGVTVTGHHQTRTVLPARPNDTQRRGFHSGGDTVGRVRHPPFLDLEQVGEVTPGDEGDRAGRLLRGDVADGEVLTHPVAHVAPPDDQQCAVGPAGRRRHSAGKNSAVRLRRLRAQRLGGQAVDGEFPPGQHTRIPDEQPLRVIGRNVAAGTADAERRTLDQRHRIGDGWADRCPVE